MHNCKAGHVNLFRVMRTVAFWIYALCMGTLEGLLLHTPNGTTVHIETPYSGNVPSQEGVQDGMLTFLGSGPGPHSFREVLVEGDHMLVGSRNVVYNISLIDQLTIKKKISWAPTERDAKTCSRFGNTEDQCHNYIRVIGKRSENEFVVCGTNAYKPWCRTYRDTYDEYVTVQDENGIGYCPFDEAHNNTATVVDGKLFAGTVADVSARDALLYRPPVRTEHYDSQWLNDPDFVHSFAHEDKVYFFFREVAVEYINCGRAVYSRVARVCKNDQGGFNVLKNTWTSFFKARLNCSIPGEFPFYFDEIQSTTDIGHGHFRPTLPSDETEEMVYAVFNTPLNSISGSAVCAYRLKDIMRSFEGQFKEQKSVYSAWLPVRESEVPHPHPAQQCHNNTQQIPDQTLNFIKMHPLMDQAIPAFGGKPILIQASFSFRMTRIAVDWQYKAIEGHRYDILFLGTDDGRVIKAINKNRMDKVETVIIEDIQVFEDKAPIMNLKVFRNADNDENLIIVSKEAVKTIPLHRCHLQKTCSECVHLQDPYCSWSTEDKLCINLITHHKADDSLYLQNIETGMHSQCGDGSMSTASSNIAPTPSPTTASTVAPPCEPCTCDPTKNTGEAVTPPTPNENRLTPPHMEVGHTTDMDNHIPQFSAGSGPELGASVDKQQQGACSPDKLAIAVVVSIVAALSAGFLVGFYVSHRFFPPRSSKPTDNDNRYDERRPKVQNPYDLEPYDKNVNTYVTSPPFPEKKGVNIIHNSTKDTNKVRNTNLTGSIEVLSEPHKDTSRKVYV